MDKGATLRDILEEARLKKGLSKEAAARALRTTPPTYRGWLRGQQPDWDRLTVFVTFTGRSEGEIVTAIRNSAKGVLLSSPLSMVAA
jgi:hypothetical protein